LGDARLGFTRSVRESVLFGLRAAVGAGRYARWRRGVLDAFSRVAFNQSGR
jgi:hypothetical protein